MGVAGRNTPLPPIVGGHQDLEGDTELPRFTWTLHIERQGVQWTSSWLFYPLALPKDMKIECFKLPYFKWLRDIWIESVLRLLPTK